MVAGGPEVQSHLQSHKKNKASLDYIRPYFKKYMCIYMSWVKNISVCIYELGRPKFYIYVCMYAYVCMSCVHQSCICVYVNVCMNCVDQSCVCVCMYMILSLCVCMYMNFR